MAKHTLKILRWSHCKIFKYVWPFMHERVKEIVSSNKKTKIGNMGEKRIVKKLLLSVKCNDYN